ncbi:MAG: hypothetical protein PHZ19_09770 [Candidatus Thermoplasmatota archaeon]|nr:hypothetical protein [Candidatus Thermoplasmatota archaeon]
MFVNGVESMNHEVWCPKHREMVGAHTCLWCPSYKKTLLVCKCHYRVRYMAQAVAGFISCHFPALHVHDEPEPSMGASVSP